MHGHLSPCWPRAPARRRADNLPSGSASLLIRDAALTLRQRVPPWTRQRKDCFLRNCELLGQVHPPLLRSALAFAEPATSRDKLLAHDSALWAGSSPFLSTGALGGQMAQQSVRARPTVCRVVVTGKFHSFKGKTKTCFGLHL